MFDICSRGLRKTRCLSRCLGNRVASCPYVSPSSARATPECKSDSCCISVAGCAMACFGSESNQKLTPHLIQFVLARRGRDDSYFLGDEIMLRSNSPSMLGRVRCYPCVKCFAGRGAQHNGCFDWNALCNTVVLVVVGLSTARSSLYSPYTFLMKSTIGE